MKKIMALILAMATTLCLNGIMVSAEEGLPENTEDYVASETIPENLILNPRSYNAYQNIGTFKKEQSNYTYVGRYLNAMTFTRTEGNVPTWNPHGTEIKTPSSLTDPNLLKYSLSEDFISGQNYVVSARVRLTAEKYNNKNSDTDYETDSAASSVPFGIGIGVEGNPVEAAALAKQDVTSSDWQDFKYVIKAPEFETENAKNYKLLIGLMTDFTELGGGAALDMSAESPLYIAKEEAYDVAAEAGQTIFVNGIVSETDVQAYLLNQLGIKMDDSGSFKWYVTNENKTAAAGGIVIEPTGSNTAKIRVEETAAPGKYNILAVSDSKGWVKTIPVVVEAMPEEHIAGERSVSLHTGKTHGSGTSGADKDVVATSDGFTRIYEKINTNITDKGMYAMHGEVLETSEKFVKDTPYVVEVWAKNVNAEAVPNVQLGIQVDLAHVGVTHVWDIDSAEYKKYTAVVTPNFRDTNELVVGIPYNYTTIGGKVAFEYRTEVTDHPFYIAKESKHDIKIKVADSNIVIPIGEDVKITAEAELLNQIGTVYTGEQGTFSWLVMNEDKTAMSNDIKVTTSADGKTAVITAADTAKAGRYNVIAVSEETGWARTLPITLEKSKEEMVTALAITSADGVSTLSATVENSSRTEICFALAAYTNGKLADVSIRKVAVENGEAKISDLHINTSKGDKVKAYVWSESMTPINVGNDITTETTID